MRRRVQLASAFFLFKGGLSTKIHDAYARTNVTKKTISAPIHHVCISGKTSANETRTGAWIKYTP
jgi:hypothetical protein